MKPRARRLVIALLAVVAIGGAVLLVTRRSPLVTSEPAAKATYYCPMHPTYTSDRPGDCPICNMKLVKREAEQPEQHTAHSRQQTEKKAAKDICYMHNCPMVHDGKPCPMLVVAKEGEPVECPVCGKHVTEATSTKHILYWTDPMIPGYKSDKPGKSPMGMELVPVYEEEGARPVTEAEAPTGYTPILVTPQKQQLIGVKTASVQRRTLTKTIRTVGRIAYDPELYQAQQEYLQALNAWLAAHRAQQPDILTHAEQLVEAARMRLRLLGLSETFIQSMADWEEPDQRLLLADPSGQVWVYASIYEFELPLVTIGQPLVVEIPAVGGTTFEGAIQSIDAVLDPATRTARARAVVTDPEHLLKPEMFVDVSISVTAREVLVVPEEAAMHTGTQVLAFVDQGQGVFQPRRVTLGLQADGVAEVKAGLEDGERVVTSGNFLIDSESRLKAALEGLSGGGHQHGQ